MDFWSSFLNIIWVMITAVIFVTYLIALFSIITDLFRDRNLKGWAKAIWLIALILLPFVTAIVYLFARGEGMAERDKRVAKETELAAESYIRSVAQVSPSDEIAKAKALLDAGTISASEYEQIKFNALELKSH